MTVCLLLDIVPAAERACSARRREEGHSVTSQPSIRLMFWPAARRNNWFGSALTIRIALTCLNSTPWRISAVLPEYSAKYGVRMLQKPRACSEAPLTLGESGIQGCRWFVTHDAVIALELDALSWWTAVYLACMDRRVTLDGLRPKTSTDDKIAFMYKFCAAQICKTCVCASSTPWYHQIPSWHACPRVATGALHSAIGPNQSIHAYGLSNPGDGRA